MLFNQLVWYFAIYSLIGWIFESIYLLIKFHKIIDTGFLKGPFCPIYGLSALVFINFLSPFNNHPILFFITATIIATIFEYLTAFILETTFKIKFWDYSKFKFNYQGRIALPVSLTWGALALIIIHLIHPFFVAFVDSVPILVLSSFTVFFLIYYFIDTAYTTVSLFGLKKILKRINQLPQDFDTLQHQIRFFKAFPDIKSSRFDLVEKISQKINDKNAIIQ